MKQLNICIIYLLSGVHESDEEEDILTDECFFGTFQLYALSESAWECHHCEAQAFSSLDSVKTLGHLKVAVARYTTRGC